MKLSDMQHKDIVYLKDGSKLGKIIDAEVEISTGRIISLCIEKKNIRSIFNSDKESDVLFSQIKKIGEDVILVDTLE